MASATRGKYSQREWDKMQGGKKAAPVVASPTFDPKNPYSSMGSIADSVSSASKSAADTSYIASVLPSALKEAFRKEGDPALTKAISEKQQQVMGGAIEGLSKYSDISDPFKRRALAEKYQGGLSVGLSSLTSEQERRQGKLDEYINKWSGLFGAEAARKNAEVNRLKTSFDMNKSMADTAESKRRWDIEQADKKSSAALKPTTYSDIEVRKMINEGKGAGWSWQKIADTLGSAGIDVTQGSLADSELRRLHGLSPIKAISSQASETDRSPKQQFEDKQYSSMTDQVKGSREEAKDGEMFWKNGKLYRKGSGWLGANKDEEVKL